MTSSEHIFKDIQYLTEVIGVRITGTAQEREAAQYLKERFLEYLPKCEIEEFPVMVRDVKEEKLEVKINGEWQSFNVKLFNMSPTTNGNTIEAEIVFFDGHTDYQRDDISYINGKAVLHFGFIPSEEAYRRLMNANPAFIMSVDTRYTSELPIANSYLPAYVAKYGAVPNVDVPFYSAWEFLNKGAKVARLNVSGGSVPGVTLMRNNCEAGKFYHHRPDNCLSNISTDIAAELAMASAKLIEEIANSDKIKDVYTTDSTMTDTVLNLWDENYGGWK